MEGPQFVFELDIQIMVISQAQCCRRETSKHRLTSTCCCAFFLPQPSLSLPLSLSLSLSFCIVRVGLCIFLRLFESYYIPPSPLHSPWILSQGFFSIHQAAQSPGQNVPANHRWVHRCVFKRGHIIFTLHVYCLTFLSGYFDRNSGRLRPCQSREYWILLPFWMSTIQ